MRKIKFFDYIKGYTVLQIPKNKASEALNVLFNAKVIFRTLDNSGEFCKIILPYSEMKRIKKSLASYGDIVYTYGGGAYIAAKYRKRPGILVGAALCAVIIFLSSMLVWDIEIRGNDKLSDSYICSILENYGLKVGVLRSSVNLNKLHQEILLDNGNLGWLRVNFRGTHAIVEVIEYSPPDKRTNGAEISNLVASEDAVILSVDVFSGTAAVKPGDTVKKGDLLVSGIVDSNLHGYNLKGADAIVIGEVADTFKAEVPLKKTEKVYTGKTYNDKYLIFLGHRIHLSDNLPSHTVTDERKEPDLSENSAHALAFEENCDIISNRYRVELFDTVKLPVEIEETVYNEFEEHEAVLSEEQAAQIAYSQFENYLSEISVKGDLISEKVTTEATDQGYVLTALIYRTEDISKRAPIFKSNFELDTSENNLNKEN